MNPTYHSFQIVVLDKRVQDYKQGDVIAFNCEGLSSVLVKRIAAEPGDSVVITDGTLWRNERVESAYEDKTFDYAGILKVEKRLSDGEYIMIGDNISESKDSRYDEVGIVKEENIIGRVL